MIDLSDFCADLTVTVSADGSTPTFTEAPSLMGVLLSDDPGLGDPEVIFTEIGGVGQILSFDYNFAESTGNDDEFRAVVFGSDTGPILGALL
jgi:hypothetical protein